jgi:predicted nucleic acid-binding protein
MAWCFEDESSSSTDHILNRLGMSCACVPVIWPLEVGNVLITAERKKRLTEAQSIRFLEILGSLPIKIDSEEFMKRAFKEIISLARRWNLSTYDSSYLELAIRLGIPLATQDTDLARVAKACGVKIL